jgi:hypothetical protein
MGMTGPARTRATNPPHSRRRRRNSRGLSRVSLTATICHKTHPSAARLLVGQAQRAGKRHAGFKVTKLTRLRLKGFVRCVRLRGNGPRGQSGYASRSTATNGVAGPWPLCQDKRRGASNRKDGFQ